MASEEHLSAAMRRFTIENNRLDDAVARRHGISPADLHALEHLQITGGMTPGQLAERLQMSSGAVTALADRMEEAGLLTRAPHPSDRRSTLLRLTAQAERFCAEAYEPFGADMARVARRLNAGERGVVARFMDDVAEVAAEHAARQAGGQPSSAVSSEGSVTGALQAKRSHT